MELTSPTNAAALVPDSSVRQFHWAGEGKRVCLLAYFPTPSPAHRRMR